MKKLKFFIAFCLIMVLHILPGCSKRKFLDANPNSDIVIPNTLEDLQALLDYDNIMSESPALAELSADNYYISQDGISRLKTYERNSYTWEKDIFNEEGNIGDWNKPYEQVFYANVVLEGLAGIPKETNELQWNKIKGSALFIRAYAFYNLAQIFSPIYDSATAETNKYGIPLRLTANINNVSVRSTINETYSQILSDLTQAASLLPENIERTRNRPNKPAAFAMLARVYLSMGEYRKAGVYADSSLNLYDALIDYNSITKSQILPFQPDNLETLYQSKILSNNSILRAYNRNCIVDSTLFKSYSKNDLRPDSILFIINSSGFPNIKGSYNGSVFLFSGLATDEVYLIRAECSAKLGYKEEALNDLNKLLAKRWKTGTYIPYTSTTAEEARQFVLTERRKELAFRGLRWTDIKRLNKEGANISLSRLFKQLPPNDSRFVLPIPPDVVALSDVEQYPR